MVKTIIFLLTSLCLAGAASLADSEDQHKSNTQCFSDCLKKAIGHDEDDDPSKIASVLSTIKSMEPKEISIIAELVNAMELTNQATMRKTNNSVGNDLNHMVKLSNDTGNRKQTSNISAFTVEVSTKRSLSDQAPVTFDQVIYDEEKLISLHLGTFQCPDSGVYAFYWSVDASDGRVDTVLVRNGVHVKKGQLPPQIEGSFSSSSTMSAIAECNQGDLIWIQAIGWPDGDSCNIVEGIYTTFTGYKLFESSDDPTAKAFTADLSSDSYFPISVPIVYDNVLTNIGGNYNPNNGMFMCPETGVYVFTVSVHYISDVGSSSLNRNGQFVTYMAFPKNTHNTSLDSGTSTSTCILECTAGDFITIVSGVDREHMAHKSSFSGYRLVDDDKGIVAFTAFPAADRQYFDGQQILFDNALTNVGGRYYPGVSYFVCQDEDLYAFHWSIFNFPEVNERSTEVRLMMIKDQVERVLKVGPRTSQVFSPPHGRSASGQAVVRCEMQAAIFLQAVVATGPAMTFDSLYTSFSGFRLPTI